MENYNLKYNVDIVFCIDCTESMDNILNIIKRRAMSFHGDLMNKMMEKDKVINSLRVRVVAFRDYRAFAEECKKGLRGNEPMLVSDFFQLPMEADKLSVAVRSIQPVGGGDAPEDGLEALAYAIRSDWDRSKDAKHRQVIVLWSDSEPHALGHGMGTPRYPNGMAKSLRELTAWWGDPLTHGYCNQEGKRLLMFVPDSGSWHVISEQWDNVILYPSVAGGGLNEYNYGGILDCIAHTLG